MAPSPTPPMPTKAISAVAPPAALAADTPAAQAVTAPAAKRAAQAVAATAALVPASLALAAAVALTALAGCHRQQQGGPPQFPPPDVSVVTIAATDVPLDFTYLGRTEGSREVEIRARVGGFLERRAFTEGAMVAAGDLLFAIDDKPLQAQAAAARAEVAAATAQAEWTERERLRLDGLVAEDAVSKKEHDDATSAAAVAQAQLAAAKARLQQIEVDLQYTHVTAPIAGKIGRAMQQEGSLVSGNGGPALTTLLQLDPIHVLFQRTENQQARLDADLHQGRLRLPASGAFAVEIRARDGTVLATGGAIDYVGGRLDDTTATIPMRAVLPNADLRLRAGQAVDVVLRGGVLAGALCVPQRAVVESPQGKQVYVAVSNDATTTVAEARRVELGEWVELRQGDTVERAWVVRSGIAAGDRVIVDNLVRLSRMLGAPVHVLPEHGSDEASAPIQPPLQPALQTEAK